MLRSTSFLLLLFSLVFSACNNSSSQENQKEGMSQFADDEKFKNVHEKPEQLEFQATGELLKFPTPDGKEGSAYTLKAKNPSQKFLFVIHEWWGLNDHIKREAERFYGQLDEVNVMALDLYDGQVASTPEEAGTYMESVTEERAEAIIRGAMNYAGPEAEIATIGWCFGGGWSLKSSIMAGAQGAGCVMYYGMPVETAAALNPLQVEVLGIFAEKDEWITPEVVDNFAALAKKTGKSVETYQFPAAHAFANPSSPRYNEEAAQKANALALDFLKEKLK